MVARSLPRGGTLHESGRNGPAGAQGHDQEQLRQLGVILSKLIRVWVNCMGATKVGKLLARDDGLGR